MYDQKTIFQLKIDTFIHANIIKDEIILIIDINVTTRINLKKYKLFLGSRVKVRHDVVEAEKSV